MVPVERILADWQKRANQISPKVWAGHYQIDPDENTLEMGLRLIGELSLPEADAINAMWGFMPFALSHEVDISAVVMDMDSELWIGRMSIDPGAKSENGGVKSTFWVARPSAEVWGFETWKRDWPEPVGHRLGPIADSKLSREVTYSYEAAALAVSNCYES